jgi:hypothetical protein
MQERIFTLKKGTEVPAQFDGATVPFQVPASNEEMISLAGDKAYVVFNEAYSLRVQKHVKDEANEENQTIEGLRKAASGYKIGEVRTRKGGTAKPKTPSQIARAAKESLLDEMLANDPELKARYEAKQAELRAKAAETTPAATNGQPASAPEAPAVTESTSNQSRRRPAGR